MTPWTLKCASTNTSIVLHRKHHRHSASFSGCEKNSMIHTSRGNYTGRMWGRYSSIAVSFGRHIIEYTSIESNLCKNVFCYSLYNRSDGEIDSICHHMNTGCVSSIYQRWNPEGNWSMWYSSSTWRTRTLTRHEFGTWFASTKIEGIFDMYLFSISDFTELITRNVRQLTESVITDLNMSALQLKRTLNNYYVNLRMYILIAFCNCCWQWNKIKKLKLKLKTSTKCLHWFSLLRLCELHRSSEICAN